MGKTPEQILSDIRGIKAETDPHDITAPRLGGTLEDMLAFSKDTAEKVDGLPGPSEQNYKGKITITDLLALSVDIGDNDLYLVYSSGSDDEGWSDGGTFSLNGSTYSDGTFVQWMGDGWMAVNAEDVNIEKVALFNPLSDKMDIIVKTYPQTSYDHLYGRSRYGMMIADVACYELDDETGAYKPKIERMTGQYAGSTNLKTLIVPYARRYHQGGEYHYEGGVLSAADYQRLMEGQQVDGGVFVATYGETTFDELVDAYEEGKMIVVRNGGNTSVLGYFYVNEFRFYSVDLYSYDSDAVVTCISMSFNDGWSIPYSRTTENRGNRVSSTALTPSQLTDYKYLSALAVKTLIEEYVEALARVAKTGDYNDLINKPTIPSGDSEAVKYTAQVLTSARQEQARNNISAASQLLNNLADGAGLNMVLKFTTSDIENLFRLKISKKNGVTVTKDDDTEDCILMSNSYVGNSGASKVPISDVVRSFIPFKEVFFDNGSYNTCTVPIIVDNLLAATHTVVVRLCNNRGNYFPGNVQFYDPYGWFDVADNVKDLQIIFVSTAAKRTVSSGSITDNKGNINHLTSPDTLNVYVTDGTDVNDVSTPKWTCTFNNSTNFSNYVLERFYINNGTMYHAAYDSITDIMTSNASLTKFL